MSTFSSVISTSEYKSLKKKGKNKDRKFTINLLENKCEDSNNLSLKESNEFDFFDSSSNCSRELKARETYYKEMRKTYSSTEMLNKDFTINQDYFRRKKGSFWNYEHEYTLEKAVKELGENCSSAQIKEKYLISSSLTEIQLRKSCLINYNRLVDFLNRKEDT